MVKNAPSVIITSIAFVSIVTLYLINASVLKSERVQNASSNEYGWIIRMITNVLSYATVFIPGYLIYKYVKTINYANKNGDLCSGLIHKCFGEDDLLPNTSGQPNQNVAHDNKTPMRQTLMLMFYFVGLQVSYLSWGVIQEKVMTTEYQNDKGDIGHFKDSQFLVFVNRILAVAMSAAVLCLKRHPRHKCPLYKYVFCSLSNIMSSWCQYEALKYVSFPHQVLAKSAKTIPVMIMGKIVVRTKYEYYEYVTAVILSCGMLIFMLDMGNDRATSTSTTFSGALLLISYITFDSFTSNWQGALFTTYQMKPVQMMCFVNLFSCIFTGVSLSQQGGFTASLDFMWNYPHFVFDCLLLSLCSAGGQLFIFSTLSDFGPLVFAIITTIRQGFSVFLSCLIYNHRVSPVGVFGVVLVFISVLLRIYCGHRLRNLRQKQTINASA